MLQLKFKFQFSIFIFNSNYTEVTRCDKMSLNVANAFIQRLERNEVSFDILQSYTGKTGRVWGEYIYIYI